MGNNTNKNDDFSKNPNFNINAHQQAMQNIARNYQNANFNVPYQPQHIPAPVQQTQLQTITRSSSIYKPSFNIILKNQNILVQFQYLSQNGSKLQLFFGVTDVKQNEQTQITQYIQSKINYEDILAAGKKVKYSRTFPLSNVSPNQNINIIVRISSLNVTERTQYSLQKTKLNSDHWTVLVQKLQFKGRATQLQNIYRGGGQQPNQQNQCIICLTQPCDTLIQPCNHLCICKQCCNAVRTSTNKCPICRKFIKDFKTIILQSK